MAAKNSQIDLVQQLVADDSPFCPHGPAFLFERYDKATATPRRFYACSAFRDRKVCSFFQWADEKQNKSLLNRPDQNGSAFSHRDQRKRYHKFRKMARKDRHVCCTCGKLLLEGEADHHAKQGHTLKHRVGLKNLKKASYLFSALDDNKTFAQYLFSEKTVDFLLSTIEHLGFTHVLCVGAPRIHEAIQMKRKAHGKPLKSMLLDLDDRYAQLYPPAKFTKYNMFNHHFFESQGVEDFKQFLASGGPGTLLLTDPPFGGMVEALASSFKKLSETWRLISPQNKSSDGENESASFIPTMWIFPYFMETRILSEMPSGFHMLDYKVDYDNHNLFQNQHKKKGSPVRIFTNISAASIPLPSNEGYRFCEPCQRYSSQENEHCKECKTCPSKDGTTYIHCDMCMRCVKSTYVHCFKCEACKLKDHICGGNVSAGCHICGEMGHKRRECPRRGDQGKTEAERKNHSINQGKRKYAWEACHKKKMPRI